MRALWRVPLLVLPLLLHSPNASTADALPVPSGAVVLTVAGAIGKTNRPAFDAFEDGFLGYHEKQFEKAAAFDRAMLESLDQQSVTLQAPNWPGPIRFEGPWLADVLEAVDAAGESVTVVALDGYAVEIGPDELAAQDWLLAIARGGEPLGIGQRGPTWLVYERKDGQAPTHDDEARWPWSVFYIEIE